MSIRRVLEGGYCIGCGACCALPEARWHMRLDPNGLYRPSDENGHPAESSRPPQGADAVCPFSSPLTEPRLAAERYGGAAVDPLVGHYRALWAGAVQGERSGSSSGGLATWVLTRLLASGAIDGVLHTAPVADDPDGVLFRYRISRTPQEIAAGGGSHYYPSEYSRVLAQARAEGGRYALVGLPCCIKAARLLARHDPAWEHTIAYTIGLVCGHLKSTAFAQYLAWQLGVPPQELAALRFRVKRPDAPANRYAVRAIARDGSAHTAPAHTLRGTDWGQGWFKPRACDYCDDLAAETADLTCGDAWLPQYTADPGGTNLLVVRHAGLQAMLQAGAAEGALWLHPLTPADFRAAQGANVRHRRHALAWRLARCDAAGRWRPPKRTAPDAAAIGPGERLRQRLRRQLARRSHGAFRAARAAHDPRRVHRRLWLWQGLYQLLGRGLLRPLRRLAARGQAARGRG